MSIHERLNEMQPNCRTTDSNGFVLDGVCACVLSSQVCSLLTRALTTSVPCAIMGCSHYNLSFRRPFPLVLSFRRPFP